MTRVLIVDDDQRMCTAVASEVQRLGYEALTADSLEAAHEILIRSKIEVLVTDLRMAGRDGLDLIRMARAASPSTVSVLMSAYATAADYKLAVQQGAVEVLTKPFQPEDLELAIRKALHSSQGLKGSVHALSLADLIQVFHMGRRSLRIEVGDQGRLFMKDGEIIHAVYGSTKGKAALRALLDVQQGNLQTLPPQACEVTIACPLEALLLEMAKEADEEKRDLPIVAPAPIEFPTPPPPRVREESMRQTFDDPAKRWIPAAAAAAVIGALAAAIAIATHRPKEELPPTVIAVPRVRKKPVKIDPPPQRAEAAAEVGAVDVEEAEELEEEVGVDRVERIDPARRSDSPKGKRVAAKKKKKGAQPVDAPPPASEPQRVDLETAESEPVEPEPVVEKVVEKEAPKVDVVEDGRPRIGVVDQEVKPAVGIVDDGENKELLPLAD